MILAKSFMPGFAVLLILFRTTELSLDENLHSGRIRIIVYNVQFLPGIAAAFNQRSDAQYRRERIAEEICDYDIVGLCEVFDFDVRRKLLDQLGIEAGGQYAAVVPDSADRSPFGIDSGLVLLSRFPVLQSHHVRFGNDSTILQYGVFADGFAWKGVLHSRIMTRPETSDGCIDVFVTHLESRDDSRREVQYQVVANCIKQFADVQNPVILMGDLNTVGNTAQVTDSGSHYAMMSSMLRSARRNFTDACQTNNRNIGTSAPHEPNGGDRIDYIFLSRAQVGNQLVLDSANTMTFPDSRVEYLSDHAAVVAELHWKPLREQRAW